MRRAMMMMAAAIATPGIMMPATAAAPVGTPTAASVKDGVDAWQRGDYARAVAIWRPQAEGGDADAAFNLAQAYKLGRGVTADLAQAKIWYGKAAQAGHVQGAANYGLLLFQDGDRKSAMPWIIKASEAGDPRAQYVHGTALFNGDILPKDWPKAYALMTRAAAAGLPQATTSLSQMDQYMSLQDRQKGLDMASRMAALPVPPTGRHIVTGGEIRTVALPPSASAQDAPAPSHPIAQAASRPVRPQPLAPPKAALAKATPAEAAPKPSPAPVAAAGGRWLVQLGAYGSQAAAESAWRGVAGRLGGLQPRYEKAGAMIRLRAGPLADRAAAARACAAAKSACFPVAP